MSKTFKTVTLKDIIVSGRLGGNYSTTLKYNGKPLIKMGNLTRGKINLKKVEYILDKNINSDDLLSYGDVLFNTRNTPELVGKIAIWKGELKEAYYNSNIMKFKFNNEYVSNNFFMNYLFNTKDFISKTNSIAIGTTSVAAIYMRDLLKLSVCLAPKKEQEKIANTLTNIDNLIDLLQKCINKKENLKLGFMKEYLTGNKVLANYDGKIKSVKIGEILESIIDNRGKTPPTVDNGIPLIEVAALKNTNIDYSKIEKYVSNDTYNNWFRDNLDDGDVLFSTVGTTALTSLYKKDIKACIAQNIVGLRFKNVYKPYISYLLNLQSVINNIRKIEMGAVQPSIKVSQLVDVYISIHSNIEEQKAIADIITKMDKEIELLKKKKQKYEKIREGMMEDLLTGKVRLI